MRIAHISIYPPKGEKHSSAGGVASYTKNLVTNIPYAITDKVFVLCNILTSPEEYKEDGIIVKRCFNKSPRFFFQILKEIKNTKPDVIHIQQELYLFGGSITGYLLQWLVFFLARNSKVIITLHGVVDLTKVDTNFVQENNSSLPSWAVRAALRKIYIPLCKYAHALIVHEEKFKKILVKDYGITADKISVIHHGIEDLKPINKEVARKNLKIGLDKHVVLFMGYLTGYKGIDILIEGFSEYAKSNPPAYLIIGAGKHPKLKSDSKYLIEYDRLVEKAKQIIPTNQYTWQGFIDEKDIGPYYSASDVSIYPYTVQMSSSGPMSLATAYSRPFLASTAFRDVFPTQILFEQTSSSLAEKLNSFFKSGVDLSKLSTVLRSERLWNVCGKRTKEIYENL